MRRLVCVALIVVLRAPVFAAAPEAAGAFPTAGEIYNDACASCHGTDGRGAPEGTALSVPLPDFTDCNFVTREGTGNWHFLLVHGGVGLGLSPQMPAFAGVLSEPQIDAVLEHLRSFCHDPRWPRGDLNFPRLLLTDKAFPEDEVVLVPSFTKGRDQTREWNADTLIEHRVGTRAQVEMSVPLALHDARDGPTTGGVGDVALAYKHVLYANAPSRTIASASIDLVVPSGDRHRGLGSGTVSFEPALLAGKQIGRLVLQAQVQGIAPVDETRADRAVRYLLACSYATAALRRAPVASIELETLHDVTARQTNLFVTPELYVGLSKRGHIGVALGAQVPVAGDADPFDYRVLGFVLWDYADGGLWW